MRITHPQQFQFRIERFCAVALCILALAAGAAYAGSDDFGDDAYILPLVGDYAVHRSGSLDTGGENGKYQLVERSSPATSVGFTFIVPDVEQIAVVQKIIVGRAKKGLFLLDSNNAPLTAEFFDSAEKWHSAMTAAGVPVGVQLNNPDALTANVSEQVLRPWNFRVMKALLGLPDDLWSLIVQALGLLTAIVLGVLTPAKRSPMAMAVVLGIAVDVVAMMVIAGEGGSAFVGLLGFPIIFYFAAVIGKTVRRLVGILRRPTLA